MAGDTPWGTMLSSSQRAIFAINLGKNALQGSLPATKGRLQVNMAVPSEVEITALLHWKTQFSFLIFFFF